MAGNIGEIKIQVSAEEYKAVQALKRLCSQLDTVSLTVIKVNNYIQLMKTGFDALGRAVDLVSEGAAGLDIERAFKKQAQNIGLSTEYMMAKIRKATNGTMTEIKAMMLANQALINNMRFDDFITTLEYLRRYASQTGKSFDQLANTIMTGLTRGSTLMLDDAGIIIDQTEIIKQKTAEWGRELSEAEKKAVIVAEAIKQMKEKMDTFSDASASAADKIERISTYWKDFKQTAKEILAEGAIAVIDWVNYKFGTENLEFKRKYLEEKIAEMQQLIKQAEDDLKDGYSMAYTPATLEMMREKLGKLEEEYRDIVYQIKTDTTDLITHLADAKNRVQAIYADMERKKQISMKSPANQQDVYIPDEKELKKIDKWYEEYLARKADAHLLGRINAAKRAKSILRKMDEPLLSDEEFDKAYMEGLAALEKFGDDKKLEGLIKAKERVDDIKKSLMELSPVAKMQADLLKGAFENIGFVLSETMAKFATEGKFSFKELVSGLVKELQIYAAQKTAMLLMEAAYQGVMSFIDTSRAAEHSSKAMVALKGAAVMGSFVAGSGLTAMAHSGLDYIPEDGTWFLQKGERVIDSKTNRDLKEYLKQAGRPSVVMNVTINGGDEESVLKALPRLKQTIIEVVSGDIAANGQIRKTILTYT
ncbi:hypothetical protein [Deferribacter abyssi]|uniref:hypothetical protein n=1 Tax=Deferribacter abyssi TaxID=213806 RepID=UPI003C253E13